MSKTNQYSNQIIKVLGLVLCILLLLPFILMGMKILHAYADLKDVRFQSEKILRQQQAIRQDLRISQQNMSVLQRDFKPLNGSAAQANAALQSRLRKLITLVGGSIETSSQAKAQNKMDPSTSLRPVSINVRWSVSEAGLGEFLVNSASPKQNLKINSLLIRRRQGTASLIDIRMQCSALWKKQTQDQFKNGTEGRK